MLSHPHLEYRRLLSAGCMQTILVGLGETTSGNYCWLDFSSCQVSGKRKPPVELSAICPSLLLWVPQSSRVVGVLNLLAMTENVESERQNQESMNPRQLLTEAWVPRI